MYMYVCTYVFMCVHLYAPDDRRWRDRRVSGSIGRGGVTYVSRQVDRYVGRYIYVYIYTYVYIHIG